ELRAPLALSGLPQEAEERHEDRDESCRRYREEREKREAFLRHLLWDCDGRIPLAEREDDRAVDRHDGEETEAEGGLPGDPRQHADHDAEQQPEYRHSPASAHRDLPRVSRRPTDGRSAS